MMPVPAMRPQEVGMMKVVDRSAESGFPIKPVYRAQDVAGGLAERLGEPGQFPFTRGVYSTMYTRRPWTMRQYAGYGTAAESNARYHQLRRAGQTGLSVAFDLPTQMGYDSDEPIAHGEVGKVGVAIDSIEDMRTLFDGIPLDEVSTSMTINAPASVLLLLYQLVGEEQGVPAEKLRGTTQNDILKEYIARGNFIYPPQGAIRLTTDLFAYCRERIPKWNTISISGYHFREKGCSAVQEVAFTLADGIAYVQAALDAGLKVDEFAPRLAFFFNGHNNFLEEVAKYRAARRLWARIMKERFGAKDPRSQMLRFHTQTAGSTLTAQQPDVNIVRTAYQAMVAALGGTQSLHTNSWDEALALPSEDAARLALRTQQVLAYETGVADTIDPLAGSYYVESLTDSLEQQSQEYIAKIDELGGSVRAIELGYIQREIEDAAYRYQVSLEDHRRIVVGVNRFQQEEEHHPAVLRVDPELGRLQAQRVRELRSRRDNAAVGSALAALEVAARGTDNLMPRILAAVEAYATLGEISDTLRRVFGEQQSERSM